MNIITVTLLIIFGIAVASAAVRIVKKTGEVVVTLSRVALFLCVGAFFGSVYTGLTMEAEVIEVPVVEYRDVPVEVEKQVSWFERAKHTVVSIMPGKSGRMARLDNALADLEEAIASCKSDETACSEARSLAINLSTSLEGI